MLRWPLPRLGIFRHMPIGIFIEVTHLRVGKTFHIFLTTYYAVATITTVFFEIMLQRNFFQSPIWKLAKHFIFLNNILCRGCYHCCILRNKPIGILSVTHFWKLAKKHFILNYILRATTTTVFFVICPLEFYRSPPFWELAKHFIFLNYILCRGHGNHHCIFLQICPLEFFSVTHLRVGKTFHTFINDMPCRGHYHHCIFS